MQESNRLHLTNTLWMRKITFPSMLILLTSLILLIEQIKGIENIQTYAFAGLIVAISILILSIILQDELEGRNAFQMMKWAKQKYNIRLSADQASELIQYGSCEFKKENSVIELCLVERKGVFSLHTTKEIDFKEV